MAPDIRATRSEIAADVEFGDDVVIEADDLSIGPGARIGFSDADDFRTPGGVRISAPRLSLGPGVQIGRAVRVEGGEISLGAGVRIVRHATIRVTERLEIGDGGTVGERCEISGRDVRLGQELWMLPDAKIGGGSAFENTSSLDAGHYLHLGVATLVNTARPVRIGHEVGLGTRTSIYTHGAYPSRLMGFPVAFEGVEIGDFSWIPGATINPGVRIGRNCVIGVNSLVTSDIPDGALAAGSPAKVIREDAYPRPLAGDGLLDFYQAFLDGYARVLGVDSTADRTAGGVTLETPGAAYVATLAGERPAAPVDDARRVLVIGPRLAHLAGAATSFDTESRRVRGKADAVSERLANELRRYGIRFYSRASSGEYVDWEASPPAFVA